MFTRWLLSTPAGSSLPSHLAGAPFRTPGAGRVARAALAVCGRGGGLREGPGRAPGGTARPDRGRAVTSPSAAPGSSEFKDAERATGG